MCFVWLCWFSGNVSGFCDAVPNANGAYAVTVSVDSLFWKIFPEEKKNVFNLHSWFKSCLLQSIFSRKSDLTVEVIAGCGVIGRISIYLWRPPSDPAALRALQRRWPVRAMISEQRQTPLQKKRKQEKKTSNYTMFSASYTLLFFRRPYKRSH